MYQQSFISRAKKSFNEVIFAMRYEKNGGTGADYTKNVNVPAMTAKAIPACAACADTVPSLSAAPELLEDVEDVVLACAAKPVPVPVVLSDGVAMAGTDATMEEEEEESATEGVALTILDGEVLFEPVPVVVVLPVRYDGAGTAVDGLTRAPVPQGIFSPSGWVWLGAGTVAPVEVAMVKRPVQSLSGEEGEVNW
jgi:hypothetical protein